MKEKRYLMGGVCLFMALLTAGCGNQEEDANISQSDGISQNIVSENVSADTAGEDQEEITVSENDSQDIAEEMEVIELSNGLYAYVTTQVAG